MSSQIDFGVTLVYFTGNSNFPLVTSCTHEALDISKDLSKEQLFIEIHISSKSERNLTQQQFFNMMCVFRDDIPIRAIHLQCEMLVIDESLSSFQTMIEWLEAIEPNNPVSKLNLTLSMFNDTVPTATQNKLCKLLEDLKNPFRFSEFNLVLEDCQASIEPIFHAITKHNDLERISLSIDTNCRQTILEDNWNNELHTVNFPKLLDIKLYSTHETNYNIAEQFLDGIANNIELEILPRMSDCLHFTGQIPGLKSLQEKWNSFINRRFNIDALNKANKTVGTLSFENDHKLNDEFVCLSLSSIDDLQRWATYAAFKTYNYMLTEHKRPNSKQSSGLQKEHRPPSSSSSSSLAKRPKSALSRPSSPQSSKAPYNQLNDSRDRPRHITYLSSPILDN